MDGDDPPSCDVCFRTDLPLSACSKCHVAKYCSKEHQKIVWYTHKHICSLLRDGDESLIWGAQCDFSDKELKYFGLVIVDDDVKLNFSLPVGSYTPFPEESFKIHKARTIAALDHESLKSSTHRSQLLANIRNYIVAKNGELYEKFKKEDRHLEPYYKVAPITVSLNKIKHNLSSNNSRHFILPFLTFYTLTHSWRTEVLGITEEKFQALIDIVELMQLVIRRINDLIHKLETAAELEEVGDKILVELFKKHLENCVLQQNSLSIEVEQVRNGTMKQ